MPRLIPRTRRAWLLAGLGAVLLSGASCACWFAAYWFDLSLPALPQSVSPASTPVIWSALPNPVPVRAQWTSFTFANTVRALAVRDRLLWAATDGGAVVFDLGAPHAPPVKFTAEHGLAANRLAALAAAPDGALWFGSAAAGLSRFDGQTWRTYTTRDGLPSLEIRDLSFAPDGVLWAATPAGLARYRDGRWRAFSIGSTLFALESNDNRAVAAEAGGVWAATGQGLAHYDGRRWTTYTYQDGLANDDVRDVALAPDGTLWAATRVGVSRYDGAVWQRYTTADGLQADEVNALLAAPDGSVWVAYGAAAAGVSRYDGVGWTTYTALDGLAHDTVFSLAIGPGGEILAGTADGVGLYAGGGWTVLEAPSEIPSNDLRGLAAARGAVWAASSAGVSRYDGARWRQFTALDGLARDDVRALAIGPGDTPWAAFDTPAVGLSRLIGDEWESLDCRTAPASANVAGGAAAPDGSVWFATDHGVSRFDGRDWYAYTAADGLPLDEVNALALAPSGELWAGTPRGLAVWQGERWASVAPDDVRLLAVDPAGTVWAVTRQGLARLGEGGLEPVPGAPAPVRALAATALGVWLATPQGVALLSDGVWRAYTEADGLVSNDVISLAVAPDERTVWAGFSDAALGFNYFDGAAWRSYPQELVDDVVTGIHVQDDGAVWVATMGGLSRYLGGEWQSFTTLDGLPSNIVLSVATAYDSVWVATPEGVGRYDGNTWQVFNSTNGLAGDRARELAVAPDGRLWVGFDRMRRGLSVFDGRDWQTVAEWNRDAVLYSMSFGPDGRLWASGRFDSPVVGESHGFLAAYADGAWAWRPLLPDWPFGARDFDIAPDGRLWAAVDGNRGVQVLDVSAAGLGRQTAYYPEAVYAAPVAVAPDGAVWVSNNFRTKLLVLDGAEWRYQSIPLSALVTAIEPAPDGSLWVGTNRGAARYVEGAWQTFRSAASLYGRPQGAAVTLAADSGGALWFGVSGGGVLRYGGPTRLNTYPAALARHEARAILQAAGGALWVATHGGGVGRFDGAAWQVFAPDPLLATAPVRALAVALDGSAWLATASGAVRVTETACGFDPRWTARTNVLAVEAAPAGGVWLGTRSAGAVLWGLDGESVFDARRQTAARVNAVHAAPDGSVWFAGEEAVFGLREGQWQRLPVESRLAETGLAAVLYAPDGRLWLGTGRGAAYREGRRWRVLTPADGLADPRVQHIAIAADGSLWFATPGGLSRYRP